MSKKPTSKALSRWSLFGPPPVLEGEDAAAYDELFGRVSAAINPTDIIDEIFVADVVSSEWEVLRWRRLKSKLLEGCMLAALKCFLPQRLEYELYRKRFAEDLSQILEDNLADQSEDDARTLARDCARKEKNAIDRVNEILNSIDRRFSSRHNLHDILDRAQADEATELAKKYLRRQPGAVKLIDELLAEASESIDSLLVGELAALASQY
jgi:hypothetical protein